jgi:hypothetical protein
LKTFKKKVQIIKKRNEKVNKTENQKNPEKPEEPNEKDLEAS